jgi:hypothetical protein
MKGSNFSARLSEEPGALIKKIDGRKYAQQAQRRGSFFAAPSNVLSPTQLLI